MRGRGGKEPLEDVAFYQQPLFPDPARIHNSQGAVHRCGELVHLDPGSGGAAAGRPPDEEALQVPLLGLDL